MFLLVVVVVGSLFLFVCVSFSVLYELLLGIPISSLSMNCVKLNSKYTLQKALGEKSWRTGSVNL